VTTGAILGGFYAAWGTWTTGGNGWDVAESAVFGAALGGALGAFDPTFGGAVILGGVVGAGGDLIGQEITNLNHNQSLRCINASEALGSGIGGALGGATGAGLGALAEASGDAGSWAFNFASQFLSGAPGYAGTAIGGEYGDQGGSNSGKGLSGRKDVSNPGGCQ
jgi:hypothetical protein